eukprot:CAMPEP_0114631118 /NCGR_PEP_ID=MMETSP0168-20121206/14242_1 /TAXON_ID=95228 ORGANISM="Vannella sp., Strain DIVA3 517/6/12" /NCGR_SAMPLE_ID=MMETSP0168 /ASSEMBLY_ACC=CAM_ASM_000044 /LENGTH=368 /DNA_ID=CAMNT_0001842663 /DNA_START=66 /DNA_END=1172 /DNA_ORIENTATION=-
MANFERALDPRQLEAAQAAAFTALEKAKPALMAAPDWEYKKSLNMIHLLLTSVLMYRADSLVTFSHKHVRGSKELPCGAPFLDRATQVYKDMRVWVWSKNGCETKVNIFNNQALRFSNLGSLAIGEGAITLYSITQTKESRKKAKFEACTLLYTNPRGRVCAVNTLKNYHPHKSGDLTFRDTCFKAEATVYLLNAAGDLAQFRYHRDLIRKTFTPKDYKQIFDLWERNEERSGVPLKKSAAVNATSTRHCTDDDDDERDDQVGSDVHYFPPQPSYAPSVAGPVKVEEAWAPADGFLSLATQQPQETQQMQQMQQMQQLDQLDEEDDFDMVDVTENGDYSLHAPLTFQYQDLQYPKVEEEWWQRGWATL